MKQGVIGAVYESQYIRVSNNFAEDTDFNNIIDIDTQLPVITLPIFAALPSALAAAASSTALAANKFLHQDAPCIGVL